MNRGGPIPFGPEFKDPFWRWGSFLIGVCTFVLLAWIATLGDINLIGFWFFLFLILGAALSARSGLAWRRGDLPTGSSKKTKDPVVDIRGQAGSTYVVIDRGGGGGGGGGRVSPKQFSPLTWALYTIFVRAPMALGDAVLTAGWRAGGGLGNGGSTLVRRFDMEQLDQLDQRENLPRPDRERF